MYGVLEGESEGRNVIKLQSHFLRYLEKSGFVFKFLVINFFNPLIYLCSCTHQSFTVY